METDMWHSGINRRRLMQNITLLWILNEIPEQPKENHLVSDRHTPHRLMLERENEIVGNLAFVSATTDDNRKVMAVCIEEAESGEAITVRVASNTGDLAELVTGFEALGRILERAARRENPKHEDKRILLREVVKFDIRRILSRLRSSHATRSRKTTGKPALIPQLNAAINDRSVKARFGVLQSTLRDLRDRAENLQILFARLEKLLNVDGEELSVQEILMEIVTQAHELTLTSALGAALSTSSVLDPGLKTFLPEAFGKIGRYYAAASELVCAARDRSCRAFLSVRIEACQFPVPHEYLIIEEPASIHEVADSIFRSLEFSETYRLERSLSGSEDQFKERIMDIARLGKIHAEIQLLFFYEIHSKPIRPRVICSSKSACYLCNLFIQLHGQFFVPRTHGRLYDRWVLPDWLERLPTDRSQTFGSIITQLNATIEDKIRALFTDKCKPYRHPNESVLVPRAHWPSTSDLPERSSSSSESTSTLRQEVAASQVSSLSGTKDRSTSVLEDLIEDPLEDDPLQVLEDVSETLSSPIASLSGVEHGLPDMETPTEASDVGSAGSLRTTAPFPQPHTFNQHFTAPYQQLTRGEPIWKQLADDSHPLRISTESIHATVSPTTDNEDKSISTNNHWVQLKWLHPGESLAADCDGPTIVHLKDLTEGAEMALRHVEVLYLCQARDVVSIKYCPKGPH